MVKNRIIHIGWKKTKEYILTADEVVSDLRIKIGGIDVGLTILSDFGLRPKTWSIMSRQRLAPSGPCLQMKRLKRTDGLSGENTARTPVARRAFWQAGTVTRTVSTKRNGTIELPGTDWRRAPAVGIVSGWPNWRPAPAPPWPQLGRWGAGVRSWRWRRYRSRASGRRRSKSVVASRAKRNPSWPVNRIGPFRPICIRAAVAKGKRKKSAFTTILLCQGWLNHSAK